MTQFDNLLRQAFEAGYERGQDDMGAEQGFPGPYRAPDFETWRAALSGLEVSDAADR